MLLWKRLTKTEKRRKEWKLNRWPTSDPELIASLFKEGRRLKKWKDTDREKSWKLWHQCHVVVLYHKVQKSKAAPSIQKKKEAVKRTQVQRMCIKLSKSQTMPNTLHENDSHEENRTNEDNISRTSILKWKQVIMNGTQCPEENLYWLKMWIETDQKLMFRH